MPVKEHGAGARANRGWEGYGRRETGEERAGNGKRLVCGSSSQSSGGGHGGGSPGE